MTASGEVGSRYSELPTRRDPGPASIVHGLSPLLSNMSADHAPLRILDASLNRASEGLRVVEDYVRFVLDDGHLTEQIKILRHELAAIGAAIPLTERHSARDAQQDVGTVVNTPNAASRANAWDVCAASLERAKQSLRSLEEFSKLAAPALAAQFESLRYRLYTLEAALGRTVDAVQRLADVRLCILVDGGRSEVEFGELIEQLMMAGVDAIQLRDKGLGDRELIARARRLAGAARDGVGNPSPGPSPPRRIFDLQGRGISRPLVIINDRPDIAAIVDADGVHLGQDDMSVKDARAIVGPRKLVGVSAHSIEQARAAVLAGANYLGVGPVFPSKTKDFDVFAGVDLLRRVAAEIRLPALAIGGITHENLSAVLAAGFHRIAVSSAVTDAADSAHAAKMLRAALR